EEGLGDLRRDAVARVMDFNENLVAGSWGGCERQDPNWAVRHRLGGVLEQVAEGGDDLALVTHQPGIRPQALAYLDTGRLERMVRPQPRRVQRLAHAQGSARGRRGAAILLQTEQVASELVRRALELGDILGTVRSTADLAAQQRIQPADRSHP